MVPNGWQKVNLKSLLSTTIKNGYSPNAVEQETGYVVLGLGALTDNKLDARSIKNVEATELVLKSQLSQGDFLISRSNTPDKVGRSCMFRGEVANCSYPDLMMKFRANEVVIEPVFLEVYLQSSRTRQYFQNCAAGSSSSMVKITKSVVEKAPVLLPPLPEQRKIAQILSTWDRSITTTEKLIEASKQQKKALMQQLLTGKKRLGYDEGTYTFKKTRYGAIPTDWAYPAIKDIAVQKSEKNSTGLDLPVLSCSKYDGFVDSLKYFKKKVYSDDTSGYRIISKGCFGFPANHIEEGSIGLQNLYEKGIVSPIYVVFQAKKNLVENRYLYALLKTDHYRQIFSAATNASVDRRGSLRWKEFSAIHVSLPPLGEQKAIADVLELADKETKLLETKLAHLKQEKKALMQQLLTGKRRVPLSS